MEGAKGLHETITQEKVSCYDRKHYQCKYLFFPRIENELNNRPTLPEGTKIITIPALEMSNIAGTDGQSALNQKVVKKTKKKWIINPVGKSTVGYCY